MAGTREQPLGEAESGVTLDAPLCHSGAVLLSIVIPTRNEERNIAACLRPFRSFSDSGAVEAIVVDNFSSDNTAAIARRDGAKVIQIGPERSAQRNRGGRESTGAFIMFVDADMVVGEDTMSEVLALIQSPSPPDALYVREEIGGSGFWARVRNFERSFYDGTCIDGLRVLRRSLFMEIGGFDESLYAGEDWDLDRRILGRTRNVGITRGALVHNEGDFSLRRHLMKKRYYATNFSAYCRKWNNDATILRQFGLSYRLWTVFTEGGKWRRSLRRPDLLMAVWLYKMLVGLVFFVGARRARRG